MKLATLCYVRQAGKTLMLHRVKKENDMHEGKWNGLGGKFDQGESPEDCVIREVFEESGLQIRNPQLKGFLTFPQFSKEHDWYVFVFEAHEYSGELLADSPEGHLEWIPDEQLLDLNLWDGDRYFLRWMLDKQFFSGKFIYRDGMLTGHDVHFY
jgi:8-oxo-dGTP diphosphatase